MNNIKKNAPQVARHWKYSRVFKDRVLYYKKIGNNAAQYMSSVGWTAPVFKLDNLKPL